GWGKRRSVALATGAELTLDMICCQKRERSGRCRQSAPYPCWAVHVSSPVQDLIANPCNRWRNCLKQVWRLVVRTPVMRISRARMRERGHERLHRSESRGMYFMRLMRDRIECAPDPWPKCLPLNDDHRWFEN